MSCVAAAQARVHFCASDVFQQGETLVAILEIPGVNKNDLDIQAKDTPSGSPAGNKSPFRKA
jgi:HSP20 family molecular chaperone IbpA